MAEYIERQKVLDLAKTFSIDICSDEEYFLAFAYVETNDIKSIPAADVRPVVRGQWVDGKCNQCGERAPFWSMATTYYRSRYCPNCGAEMEES